MKLTHGEVALAMRSLLRSLEATPEWEREGHEALYQKLNAEFVRTLPAGVTRAVAAAMDHATGEYARR